MMYTVLLFYKYIHIENPDQLMNDQRAKCQELGLKGRMIIAEEGINGTFEGSTQNITGYVEYMKTDERFANIHFKMSEGTGQSFPKLSIKVRPEIVSAHLKEKDFNPQKITGKYLTADELHRWFNEKREFYMVDMRNDYEQKSGYFINAIKSEFENFRDLPSILQKLEAVRDKPIVTYCTGGVRCEKASGYLVNEGFPNIYQLEGGIHTYMQKYPGENWLGKLYVFDQRVVIDFTKGTDKKHAVVGQCHLCKEPSENYIDCSRPECHRHLIVCEKCIEEFGGTAYCSENCANIAASVLERNTI